MAQRVFLHVGTPKTGTTFLQRVLWSHRQKMTRAGLLLPGNGDGDHYRAAIDVRQEPFRLQVPAKAEGAWSSMLPEVEQFDGDAVISHELFAPASQEQAEGAVRDLAQVAAEVHVVITARDLARQLPAEWQEHVKHRSMLAYPDWMSLAWRDRAAGPESPNGYHLWHVQHLPSLLERWGGSVDAARVHVVTVPPADAAPEELWHRFAGLLGVSDVEVDLDAARSNSSLRAEQAEVLRTVNGALGDRLPLPGSYTPIVKNFLAHQVLADRGGRPILLHPDDLRRASGLATEMTAELHTAGYDIVGDLDDLRCAYLHADPPDRTSEPGDASCAPWHGVEELDASHLLAETTEALAASLARVADLTDQVKQLRAEAASGKEAIASTTEETAGHAPDGSWGKNLLRRRR